MSGFWAARAEDGHYEILLPPPKRIRGVCGPTVLKVPILKPGSGPVKVETRRVWK